MMQFGETALGEIYINPKSHDNITVLLKSLLLIYAAERWRQQVFELLLEKIRPRG